MDKGQKCIYCGHKTVHPGRYWLICLDCLITKLVEKGSIEVDVKKMLVKKDEVKK